MDAAIGHQYLNVDDVLPYFNILTNLVHERNAVL